MRWLQRRRDEIAREAVQGAASVIRCFELVGETRWSALDVLDALSGQRPNRELVGAARSAVASVAAAKRSARARHEKAAAAQRNAAATY